MLPQQSSCLVRPGRGLLPHWGAQGEVRGGHSPPSGPPQCPPLTDCLGKVSWKQRPSGLGVWGRAWGAGGLCPGWGMRCWGAPGPPTSAPSPSMRCTCTEASGGWWTRTFTRGGCTWTRGKRGHGAADPCMQDPHPLLHPGTPLFPPAPPCKSRDPLKPPQDPPAPPTKDPHPLLEPSQDSLGPSCAPSLRPPSPLLPPGTPSCSSRNPLPPPAPTTGPPPLLPLGPPLPLISPYSGPLTLPIPLRLPQAPQGPPFPPLRTLIPSCPPRDPLKPAWTALLLPLRTPDPSHPPGTPSSPPTQNPPPRPGLPVPSAEWCPGPRGTVKVAWPSVALGPWAGGSWPSAMTCTA